MDYIKKLNHRLAHPTEYICGAHHIVFDVRTLSAGQTTAWEL